MMTQDPAQFLLAIDEIDALLHEALQCDFVSDQLYNRIITKIGAFDEAFIRLPMAERNEPFFDWIKDRIDKICEILVDAQAKSHKKHMNI